MKIEGKVALVSGGASGIGFAIADVLLSKLAKGVCVVDVQDEHGIEAVNKLNDRYGEGKVIFAKADVADKSEYDAAFQKAVAVFGQLDIVANNAGIASPVCDPSIYSKIVDVNLKGVMHGTFSALEHMGLTKGGHGGVVVNTASIAGLIPRGPNVCYAASKWGVVGFTQSIAEDDALEEIRSSGVRINAICPYFVCDTEMAKVGRRDHKHLYKSADDPTAKQFMLRASDVGNFFAEIVEDDSLNGAIVAVSGKGKKVLYPSAHSEVRDLIAKAYRKQ